MNRTEVFEQPRKMAQPTSKSGLAAMSTLGENLEVQR
jgi:hypothetical protein